ncbi:uncharacterized protein LOC144613179 [Panthera onca]
MSTRNHSIIAEGLDLILGTYLAICLTLEKEVPLQLQHGHVTCIDLEAGARDSKRVGCPPHKAAETTRQRSSAPRVRCGRPLPSRRPPPEAAREPRGAVTSVTSILHLQRWEPRAVAGGSFPRCHQLRGRAGSEVSSLCLCFQVLLGSNRPPLDKGSS